MQENDQNPMKRRDAPVPEPERVRELLIGTSGIREEGRSEGGGMEHETRKAQNETPIDQPFDPSRIRISRPEPSVHLVMERIRHGEIDVAPDFQRSGEGLQRLGLVANESLGNQTGEPSSRRSIGYPKSFA